MRAVIVRCPNCNANLQVAPTVVQATCQYCGTLSRIQARTALFQIPKAPSIPAAPPQMSPAERMQRLQELANMPIARQRVSGLLVGLMLSVLAIVGGVIFFVVSAISSITGGGGSKMMWAGHQPVLIDVDGDGVPDPIGITRYVADNDRAHFAAFSGKTGAELWESEPLGQYTTVSQGLIGGIGALLLTGSPTGLLTARDAKAKGAVKWQLQFSEKIDMMCAAGNGEIAVGTADQKWYVVDAKGAKRDGRKLFRFDRNFSDETARANFDRAGGADAGDVCLTAVADRGISPGLVVMRAWRDVADIPSMLPEHLAKRLGGPTLAIGAKTPGTRVPMIARLGTPSWVVEVPAVDLLQSALDAEHVTISDKAVFALYQGANSTHRLTAFDLASGKRLWDRPIDHTSGFVAVGLTVTGDVVMLTTWQNLIGYGVADGSDRFTIGGSW